MVLVDVGGVVGDLVFIGVIFICDVYIVLVYDKSNNCDL